MHLGLHVFRGHYEKVNFLSFLPFKTIKRKQDSTPNEIQLNTFQSFP